MTFLPIVERELRVAARRRATYRTRLLVVTGVLLLGGFVDLTGYHASPHELGMILFRTMAAAALLVCVFCGVRVTADCLSEEKREGTLGLLFLTDLKGYDVVLGKLAATSLGSFYGLLAIFPVLAIPLLMGGVTNGEFWRMSLGLADAFLFSLALGMFASAISRDAQRAMAGALGLILLFGAALPFSSLWAQEHANWKFLAEPLRYASPYPIYFGSFDTNYALNKDEFCWSLGVTHALTWLFILLACLIVPRSWQDQPGSAAGLPWRERWRKWNYGDAGERRAFRRRLLDINAFYWLASRARSGPNWVWVFLGLAACAWAWACLKVGRAWFDGGVYLFTSYTLNAVLKVWVASAAGQRLGEDKNSGALELLLSTPLSVRDILRGQWLALRRQFLGPIAVVLLVEAAFTMALLRKDALEDIPGIAPVLVSFMVMFAADVIAMGWTGMWLGLSLRNRNRATGIAAARILLLPNAAWLVISVILEIIMSHYAVDLGWKFHLGLWFGLGIFTNALCAGSARRRLTTEFRRQAVERQAPATDLPPARAA